MAGVTLIRGRRGFAACSAAYMQESPFENPWIKHRDIHRPFALPLGTTTVPLSLGAITSLIRELTSAPVLLPQGLPLIQAAESRHAVDGSLPQMQAVVR